MLLKRLKEEIKTVRSGTSDTNGGRPNTSLLNLKGKIEKARAADKATTAHQIALSREIAQVVSAKNEALKKRKHDAQIKHQESKQKQQSTSDPEAERISIFRLDVRLALDQRFFVQSQKEKEALNPQAKQSSFTHRFIKQHKTESERVAPGTDEAVFAHKQRLHRASTFCVGKKSTTCDEDSKAETRRHSSPNLRPPI